MMDSNESDINVDGDHNTENIECRHYTNNGGIVLRGVESGMFISISFFFNSKYKIVLNITDLKRINLKFI